MQAAGAGDAKHAGTVRRALGIALKVAVSVALLALISWKVPVRRALSGLSALSPAAIVAVVALTFGFAALAAVRWQRALALLGTRARWAPLLADVLVASTYNMLLPTTIGGDVVRAVRCARRIDPGHRAWSSTLFERLVGIVALVLLAVPGLIMAPGQVREIAWAIGVVAVLSVAALLAAHAPFRLGARFLVARAPSVAGAGDRIASDLSGPLARPTVRLEIAAWSLLYQLVGLGVLVVVAFDWGQPRMTWAILGAVPLALVLTMLPVSIAGLGLRESLFVILLGRFGVPADRALALALVWLALALLLAFAGGVVMLSEGGKGAGARPLPSPSDPRFE